MVKGTTLAFPEEYIVCLTCVQDVYEMAMVKSKSRSHVMCMTFCLYAVVSNRRRLDECVKLLYQLNKDDWPEIALTDDQKVQFRANTQKYLCYFHPIPKSSHPFGIVNRLGTYFAIGGNTRCYPCGHVPNRYCCIRVTCSKHALTFASIPAAYTNGGRTPKSCRRTKP